MAATFTIKRHDTLPELVVEVVNVALGEVYDFTDVTAAKFLMYSDTDPPVQKVDAVAVVVTPGTDGKLMHSFSASDTDTAGDYIAEFTATFIDGSKITAPHDGYIRVRVVADLDDE